MKKFICIFIAFSFMFSTNAEAVRNYSAMYHFYGDDEELTSGWLDERIKRGDIMPQESHIIILDLYNYRINDFAPLVELENLRGLRITSSSFVDIQTLNSLQYLRSLEISSSIIDDIRFFESLPDLFSLVLRNNQITDLAPLHNLTNLQALYLDDNQITDLTPLYSLTNLERLHLRNNPITPQQVRALRKALPDCEITHNATCVVCEEITCPGAYRTGDVNGNCWIGIDDGLEILKWVIGLESVIDGNEFAFNAALIGDEVEPSVDGGLAVLRFVIGLDSVLSRGGS